jgi:ABC-type thiamine transport system substrate-binding protein
MMLVNTTLVICASSQRKTDVIRMINLSGVAVSEGNGNTMVVKDEPDANCTTTIQFGSQQEAKEWLSDLK